MEVVTLRWPSEARRREALAQAGVPRLLVVDGQSPPPDVDDAMEDWIRTPALDIDRVARIEQIKRRASGTCLLHATPTLDRDGLVHAGDHWVALPPVEAALADILLARFGSVVSREELRNAAWPDGESQRNALDVRILRLRRRLADLSLAIRTIRSRGYLLEWSR